MLTDAVTHEVDSSDLAFRSAAKGAFRKLYNDLELKPKISEPYMNVEINCPEEFQSSVVGNVCSNPKATINNISHSGKNTVIKCFTSLDSMFGYATTLRSLTQGKGEFSLEYASHQFVEPDTQLN